MTRSIALIGPMAAGKSSLGKKYAKTSGREFIDVDKAFVAEYGSIAEYFAQHGEPAFRQHEARLTQEHLRSDAVVSLGGGAVLDPGTRAALADSIVVYLHVDAESAERRIVGSSRPLLPGGIADWTRIFAERKPIYESLADITIDTSRRPFRALVDDLSTAIKEFSE
ncbi:shikimate kinase [Humidisolicoccus flavus]|uniref:shikimate kinase n=1 Tax=Humidisolicoccus flavus TaxID=3111414 RepID=UPI00324FD42B